MPHDISWEADLLGFAIGLGSLIVSAYIAFLLHRLTRRFSQNEAIRSINHGWDSFHNAMLDKEVHDLFWNWARSPSHFKGLGERAHHIVLMYLNNIHTEYHTWKNHIFDDYDVEYVDTLLEVFVLKQVDLLALASTSGYDEDFLDFLNARLTILAAKRPQKTS